MRLRWVEFWVGVFIIASIAALLMLALQVSGLRNIFNTFVGYQVQVQFENIGGLKPKGKVVIAGVTIGRVDKIELDSKTYEAEVTLGITNSFRDIPKDSKFSILTSGLLGDNYIGITPGFSDEYLKNGDLVTSENTESALVLENLISKFLANQVTAKSNQQELD